MAILKRNKDTKKKGGENTIGKIIYGFLLFMPLLSIGARCLYVIFNKNAYESYSETEEQITYTPTTKNDLTFQKTYSYIYDPNITITGELHMNADAILLYQERQQPLDVSEYHTIYITNTRITLIQSGYSSIYANYNNGYYRIDFIYISTQSDTSDITNGFYRKDVTKTAKNLDNAFEYSIEQTEESNLYSWAKDTGTYTVLHTTTTGLGITNEFTPMLMAYWLLISVIYFIFDIALILVSAVHDKIHELKESI